MKNIVSVRACGRVLGFALAVFAFWPAPSSLAGPGSETCNVVFRLDDTTDLGALQYEVDYSATSGGFNGLAQAVSCTNSTTGIMSAYDDDPSEVLAIGFMETSLPGPANTATCVFSGPTVPSLADLAVTVIDSQGHTIGASAGNTCAAPATGQSPPFSRDASLALQFAIGNPSVSCQLCECDTDDSGAVTTSDALRILKNAVGSPVVITCPACVGAPVVSAPTAAVTVSVSLDCTPCGNGVLDPGEQCDDGNNAPGDCCTESCTFEAASSPCDNGDVCTGDTCNGAGSCTAGTGATACDDGLPCTVDTCSGTCIHTLGVDPSCLPGTKSSLLVSDNADDAKDSLKWKLSGGPVTVQADLGDPTTSTVYTLCVFDSTAGVDSLAAELTLGVGALWTDKDPKGFSYKDPTGADDGVTKAALKTGAAGKSKFSVAAKGLNLPMPAPANATEFFDEDTRVTVQLHNSTTPACTSSQFTTATKNTLTQFKAKQP